MLGKTHLAIGILLLFLLDRFTTLVGTNKWLAAVLILIASLLPDIDNSRSILGRKLKLIAWFFKHRGFFHSIFAMIFFTVIVQILFINSDLSILFMIGYASHLVTDSITVEGIQPFYPKKKKIKGPLKVGSFLETIIYLLLVVLVIYLLL